MFYIISKVLSFLTKPIVWIFIILIRLFIKQTINKKDILFLICLTYFFSNELIVDECSKIWETKHISFKEINKKYDYGIVLGGYSGYNEEINHINLNKNGDRLITAIELYHLGVIEKLLISGGNGQLFNNGLKESDWTYDLLINLKVDSNDIILENISRNTMENAKECKKIISNKTSSLLLITSSLHMRRAKFCFLKNNLDIDCLTTDITNKKIKKSFNYIFIPKANSLEKWETLIHETIGYLMYKLVY